MSVIVLWQSADKALRELEKEGFVYEVTFEQFWKINTGIQRTDSRAKDISDRENNIYDQSPENGKTLDISRQCVFGCKQSQRQCGRRFWTRGRDSLGRKAFKLVQGSTYTAMCSPCCTRVSWKNECYFKKLSKTWAQTKSILPVP